MNENKKGETIDEVIRFNDLIELYPFNGRSTFLIDKFYIIGYDYLTLHKLLIENTPKYIQDNKDKELKERQKFNIDEEPNILNEFTSDYKKAGLPNETILKMIYPKNVDFYFFSEENTNVLRRTGKEFTHLKEEYKKVEFIKKRNPMHPKSYLVVFSSNPQAENNSKKSINGLAYTFYSKFTESKVLDKKKYIYYIPYTFCIISEYPFFNSFYKLMKYIKQFYSQEVLYIPIEILIYNIVTLSPSPLNCDVKINLRSSFENEEYKKVVSNAALKNNKHYKNVESFVSESTINIKNSNNSPSSEFVIIDDDNFSSKSGNQKNFKRYNTQLVNPKKGDDYTKKEEDYTIKFNFLSGYPLIQYNLSKVLFYTLIPEKIITIFLYSFLEKDVLFFSKDIEYLSFTLNAFLNLNYPLNDEKYYFIGAPISLDDFVNGNSEFGLKNYTSIIGINDQYRSDYKNKNLKIADHLCVDLDKGEIYEINDENDNRINNSNKKIMDLVRKICRNSEDDKIRKTILYQAIKQLNNRLSQFTKIIDLNDKKNIIKINFIEYDDDSNNDINCMSPNKKGINYYNREIQEAFYEFINNICIYFYENLSIKAREDEVRKRNENNKEKKNKEQESIMNVIFNKDYGKEKESKYIEEEILFLDELSDTMKFQSFVFGFLQYYNPIDLYKIPLTFTEEFLSILSRKKENARKNIKFFNLFDSFYNTGKKDEKELNFNIVNFNYFKYYKSMFDREIADKERLRYFNQINHLVKCINEDSFQLTKCDTNRTALIYQTYELDDNILLKYIHITNNLSKIDYLGQFFESIFIEENSLKQINTSEIETKIENYCISKNVLTINDICCANIILLFTLSLKSLRENMDCTTFLSMLFQDFTVFRKYYGILLRMIYKLYQDSFSKKTYSKCKNSNLCYYPCINSIRNQYLVPNEDLLKIINQFNKLNLEDMKYPEDELKEEPITNEELKDIKLYGEQLKEDEINEENLYIFHNFTSNRFVKEEEIVKSINEQKNSNQNDVILDGEILTPKIRFNNGIHKIESLFYSQKVLLDYLILEYNNYIVDLDEKKLKTKIILDACLNIFIFMRNSDEFEEKDDIKEAVKNIFYIFMNQLYILNSKYSNNN